MILRENKFLLARLLKVVTLSFLAFGGSSSAYTEGSHSSNSNGATPDISIAFMIMLSNGEVLPNSAEGNGFERIIDYSLKVACDEADQAGRPCFSFPSSISAGSPVGAAAKGMHVLNKNDYSMEIVNKDGISLSVNRDDQGSRSIPAYSWKHFVSHSSGEVERVAVDKNDDEIRKLQATEPAVSSTTKKDYCNALCQLTGQEYWCDCCPHCGRAIRPQRNLRGLGEAEEEDGLQNLADRIKEVALEGLEKWHHKMKCFQHQADTGYILHVMLARGGGDDVVIKSSGTFG